MDLEPFLNDLAELFSVTREDLSDDFKLDANTNWDSLTIISMMALMDDHFRIEVSGERLRACSSLDQVLNIIKETATTGDSG